MIHVATFVGHDIGKPENPRIAITISERVDLLKLQALLDRALNCAPEFGADWFSLSDKLDQFLIAQGISRIVKEN